MSDKKLYTAKFLQEQARMMAGAARSNPFIEDEPVRRSVQGLYDVSKELMDARAKEIAANSRPEPKSRAKTNVGDPNPKGQAGAGKKR